MWRNSAELLATIHDAHRRVKDRETEPDAAHAEARLLGAATKVLAISLEHARLTNRLTDGNADLPTMNFAETE